MSFGKAVQKGLITPAQLEYTDALIAYKTEKREYHLFRQRMWSYEHSENPMERLQWLERVQLHSLRCKQYYAARTKWQDAAARQKCAERGIDLSAIDVAKIAQIHIPVSMRDIMLDESSKINITDMPTEEFERMKAEALAAIEARRLRDTPADASETSTANESSLAFDPEFDRL